MITVEGYENISPPPEAVQTEHIEKPQPKSESVDIWEADRLISVPESQASSEKDRAVLFSGGDDSLALTHLAMEQGWADYVVHLETNSSIPENTDYVRQVCKENHWPFTIIRSPMSLGLFGYRYGFPGSSCHTMAFHYFKGRQLSYFFRQKNFDVKFFSGVRKLESDRRMKNVTAEVQYEDASESGNFTGWWLSPLIDKSDEWVAEYREKHGLSQNPVAEKIHRSGDCQCLAYGHRDEELIQIGSEFPEFRDWLINVERRVQEYRGRIQILESEYPRVAKKVQHIRKQETPHPMRMTVLKNEYPEVFDSLVSIPAEDAILKGRTEPTNYIGHGGLSSRELREKTSSADINQMTLCENCTGPADGIADSVERRIEETTETLKERTSQQSLLSA